MNRTIRGLALAATALVAGCSTGGERPAPPVPVTVDRELAPAAYLAEAASIDLLEVKASQLAFNRSANPRLRGLARMMIEGHAGMAAQLSFAGRRLGLLPAAVLLPRHQAMLDGLAASGDFDRSYRSQQAELHRVALRLHSNYAARGSSPTLRPVARSATAELREHLAMLQTL